MKRTKLEPNDSCKTKLDASVRGGAAGGSDLTPTLKSDYKRQKAV